MTTKTEGNVSRLRKGGWSTKAKAKGGLSMGDVEQSIVSGLTNLTVELCPPSPHPPHL